MSPDEQRPARFALTFGLEIPADLRTLQESDPATLDAAQGILDDLAHGRVRGKLLGSRNVSGDLTGLARVKFDVPGKQPQRFRVVYRQVDQAAPPDGKPHNATLLGTDTHTASTRSRKWIAVNMAASLPRD